MNKKIIAVGALLTGLAVVLGAFGAHALKGELLANGKLETYKTAVDYHFIHGLALIVSGLMAEMKLIRSGLITAWLFGIGLLLFSGSLYLLSISGISILGAITPFGGLAFIAGWIILTIQLLKKK
jgi:uncharacterized membrane protein YgdD (TMEM256/DUF423 family)